MNTEYILLTVDKPIFRYDFHPNNPLVLGENAEIALKSLFLWYTFPNISKKYSNNVITVSRQGQEKRVIIPDGLYEVSHLSDFINDALLNEEEKLRRLKLIKLIVNESTFRCGVKIMPGMDIYIDFSEGDLYKLLGLEPKRYLKAFENGVSIINITRGVDKILIRCNLVDRQYQSDLRDVLYDVLPYASPGSAIQERIDFCEFVPCKDRYIRCIEIRVTDRNGQLVQFSEPISVKLVFRHNKIPL